MKITEALAAIAKSRDHVVLNRLHEVPVVDAQGAGEFAGIAVDVETTGLEDDDEVIELGAMRFKFTKTGLITAVGETFHSYREPMKPITEEITELTGITHEMVKGKSIDVAKLDSFCDGMALVVAHNARFDRKHVENVSSVFERVCWGCSMEQVPWRKAKMRGSRLEYLLNSMGMFYDAHNAVSDCYAMLYALTWAVEGRPALAHVLEAAKTPAYHVWALGSPISRKDALKKRKYRWSPGDDGLPKAWHKIVNDIEAEKEWLSRHAYNSPLVLPARIDKVSAFDRFSKREDL